MNQLPLVERTIIAAIINRALSRGLQVAVWDEESQVHPRTTDYDHIAESVGHTDCTVLRFYNAENKRVGWIQLIHGNDADVVSDYSANELTTELVEVD